MQRLTPQAERSLSWNAAWLITLLFMPHPASAWWAPGHHVVAVLAFDRLETDDQRVLLDLLKSHPRYSKDFQLPDTIREDTTDAARWRLGAAAYWPDVARQFPVWSRPTWHYQLGETLTLGAREKVNVPASPSGSPPPGATLRTQALYIGQAVALCRQVLLDPGQPRAEQAVALCWLLHLVGDAHQPCHAGSLYMERLFPEGDQGGNRILVANQGNLHALWDSNLGTNATPRAIRKEVDRIREDPVLMTQAESHDLRAGPDQWLEESRLAARKHVYSAELLQALDGAPLNAAGKVEIAEMSDAYFDAAVRVSRERALVAALRLELILKAVAKALRGSEP